MRSALPLKDAKPPGPQMVDKVAAAQSDDTSLNLATFPRRNQEFQAATLQKLSKLHQEFLSGSNPGFDCGECADKLFKAEGGGNRLYLSSKKRHEEFVTPNSTEGYSHHFIYVKNGYVLDPFISASPVPYDHYFACLKESNTGIKFAPQRSVPIKFSSDEFLRCKTDSLVYGNNKNRN